MTLCIPSTIQQIIQNESNVKKEAGAIFIIVQN